MPNQNIRLWVQKICKDGGHSMMTDKSQWCRLKPVKHYHPSALQRPDEVDKHFIKELQEGKVYCDDNIDAIALTPFFIKDETDKVRIIFHYSWPILGINISINSLVSDLDATVELPGNSDLVNFAYNDGSTTHMGKNDGESFFRQIPLIKSEYPLAVYWWRGHKLVDTRMPWGTRCAAKTAHYFSIAISYIAYKFIPRLLQPCYFDYIDDHLTRGTSNKLCLLVHVIYIVVCTKLKIKLKQSKTTLTTTKLIGLGFEYDLTNKTISLPIRKLKEYRQQLLQLAGANTVSSWFVQHILGRLEHAQSAQWPLMSKYPTPKI